MSAITVGLVWIAMAIAFAATLVSGLIKLVFFMRKKDTYRHLLKFGLLGEVAGWLAVLAIWAADKHGVSVLAEPEGLIAIPFYFMLAGQIVGLVIMHRNRRSCKTVH